MNSVRRKVLFGAAAASFAISSAAAQARTDTDPPTFEGQPVPEPGPDKSAGPVRPGRERL